MKITPLYALKNSFSNGGRIMQKTLLYTALVALLSIEAQAIKFTNNTDEDIKFYTYNTLDLDKVLIARVKPHETHTASMEDQFKSLKEEMDLKNEKSQRVYITAIYDFNNESGSPCQPTINLNKADLGAVDKWTIKMDSRSHKGCTITKG